MTTKHFDDETNPVVSTQDVHAAAVSAEQVGREEQVTREVLASFALAGNPRHRVVMQSLVKHLHAFIRDVRLSEDEWNTGIEFLTAAGKITSETRQEFILLSDVLGASMQTICVNNEAYGDETEATVFGPFFVADAPHIDNGGDIAQGAHGQPAWVEGTVRDSEGQPLRGARIEVWECDEDGYYDVQYDDDRTQGRAYFFTDEKGEYGFWGVTPVPYPIPSDGPVGDLLKAAGRSPMRASHLHFMVSFPGTRTLVTHIFVAGDRYLEQDSVFGVKESLIKKFELNAAEVPNPTGRQLDHDWARARFDIVLALATEK